LAATTSVTMLSSSKFLAVIRENKLVDESKLQECLRTLSPGAVTGEDALPITDALVERNLLTRFQANLLLQGKSKSLRITSKYRLLDRLGAGGMGLVYLCEHIRMKRLVALKVLPNSQSKEPGNLERFYREAQAVAALKHPNIVQAYDVDTDNGIHYLVMEYIDGINLEKLVSKHGPLAPDRAAHYIAQAADGLQHANERGLVHRDIKPSNLLIDREGYIKVLDMGLARFFDTRTDNITERFDNNAVIGTADFISPEQALNSHDVDIRADIYSLGCTFYYLLTGQAPYHDANITQKLLLHQIRDPVPVEHFVPGIDPELSAVLQKMMMKKPDDRYPTPGDVAAALAPWTEHAIAPPAELPANPHTAPTERVGGNQGGTATNQATVPESPPSSHRRAPRPSRGTVTERITESAIRRMDGLPRREDAEGSINKKRLIIAGAIVLVMIGGLIAVVSMRPARLDKPKEQLASDEVDDVRPPRPVDVAPPEKKNVGKKGPLAKTQALAPGFAPVRFDDKSLRPTVLNGGIRAQPTDVLLFSGPDFAATSKNDEAMLAALHSQLEGARGGQGTATPIIPFAVAIDGDSKVPNTLLTVDDKTGLRLQPLHKNEVLATKDFAAVSGLNVLVEESIVVPKGMTTINALLSAPVDFTAAPGGASLRVSSGAMLFAAATMPASATIGAGRSPLVIDCNGRTGYCSFCVGEDMAKPKGGRELILQAQFVNLGNEPLVISGLGGNVLRLSNLTNQNSRLVIQGAQLLAKDKNFRVNFTEDGNLGAAKGGVELNDAGLYLTAGATVEIDRPLNLVKQGQLATSNSAGQLKWLGRISGGKLITTGSGKIVLARRDNDQNGVDVVGGTLLLANGEGTPAGSGHVTVLQNGLLAGAAVLMKDLQVKGGVVQPGDDAGAPLVCQGRLVLDTVRTKNAKGVDKPPILRFRIGAPKPRLVVYSKGARIDLANALLQVTLNDDFKPDRNAQCVLIVNHSGQRVQNNFQNAPQFGSIKTTDGKWTAKITYDGNSERGTTSGGADVMLYDFTPLK
jgi:serine/threonine protein kinase